MHTLQAQRESWFNGLWERRRVWRIRLSARRRGESLVVAAPYQQMLPPAISLVLKGWAVSLEPRPSRDKESARRRVPNEVALRLLRNLGGIG